MRLNKTKKKRKQKKQNVKQKQYCNKFYKDFKNGPHQKKSILKKEFQEEKFIHNVKIWWEGEL